MPKSRKPKSAKAILDQTVAKAKKRSKRRAALTEKILLGTVPAGITLHFWDNNKHNGHFSNLVVCPSKEYSDFLHRRVIEVFSSYSEFIKSRDRFRKDLKRERIARKLDMKPLWDT